MLAEFFQLLLSEHEQEGSNSRDDGGIGGSGGKSRISKTLENSKHLKYLNIITKVKFHLHYNKR